MALKQAAARDLVPRSRLCLRRTFPKKKFKVARHFHSCIWQQEIDNCFQIQNVNWPFILFYIIYSIKIASIHTWLNRSKFGTCYNSSLFIFSMTSIRFISLLAWILSSLLLFWPFILKLPQFVENLVVLYGNSWRFTVPEFFPNPVNFLHFMISYSHPHSKLL